MRLPSARGPLTSRLVHVMNKPPQGLVGIAEVTTHQSRKGSLLSDDDFQLALFLCYELHYRGWEGVDDGWEWEPSLLRLRGEMEFMFETTLRDLVGSIAPVLPDGVPARLRHVVAKDHGPSISRYLQGQGSLQQFREFVAHRSVYHLREADAHTWGIPRLDGKSKAALVEIQADEYGNGNLSRMHSELFRHTMAELGMETTYGSYVESASALTLAANNVMSYFGLHRRLRGALLGHLAAFEMTSSLPNRRYGNALRKHGQGRAATQFYDEHVEADAVHEQLALNDMCGTFAAENPDLATDVIFGAEACLATENLWAQDLLHCWAQDRTSLRSAKPIHQSLVRDVNPEAL